jgi:hypothetical protein
MKKEPKEERRAESLSETKHLHAVGGNPNIPYVKGDAPFRKRPFIRLVPKKT